MNETVAMNVQDLCRGYSIGYATDSHRVPLTEHRMFVKWLSKPIPTISTFSVGGKKAASLYLNGIMSLFLQDDFKSSSCLILVPMLLISHNPQLLDRICTRTVAMHDLSP
jgi:hypothetical protein